ncbi:MAG: hypothetical protein ABI688_00365 [Bacteroidota bacterium]
MILALILFAILCLAVASSYFITAAVYKKLKKDNPENAEAWSVLVALLSFVVLGGVMFLLFSTAIGFGR